MRQEVGLAESSRKKTADPGRVTLARRKGLRAVAQVLKQAVIVEGMAQV